MENVISTLLMVGMVVNAVRQTGEFKIIAVKDMYWVNGSSEPIYFIKNLDSGHVLSAMANDLFVPGDLQKTAEKATYEIGVSKPKQDEEIYLKIKGEKELLKFLVHTTLEDFLCLDGESLINIKIKKEVKDE